MAKGTAKGKKSSASAKSGNAGNTTSTSSHPSNPKTERHGREMRDKVERLNAELASVRAQVDRVKQANERLRQEIKDSQRESSDYLLYLEQKNREKQAMLSQMQQEHAAQQDAFAERKRQALAEHATRVRELKAVVVELELKLDQRKHEVSSFADVVTKRDQYQGEVERIRTEIVAMEALHREQLAVIDRTLFDERVRTYAESEVKLKEVEAAASEHAATFLHAHIHSMELDNKRLRNELATAIRQTEDYAKMKTILERQHQDLERERAIREQVQRARRERVEMSLQSAAVKFKSGGASGDDEDVGKALEQRKVNIVVEEPVS